MIEMRAMSIAALRGRIRELDSPIALRRWSELLLEDSRAGARGLAEGCQRRADRIEAERARLERLFALRAKLRSKGARVVAGVDEVGVGPLAGPVVAAAVALPDIVDLPRLNDSKKVPTAARETLALAIREQAVGIGIGSVEPLEIDKSNIFQATLEAMRRAVVELMASLGEVDSDRANTLDHLLVDARTIPRISIPQTAIIGGDGLDGSIAAASIVAKVHRDAIMRELDERYAGYGFSAHKGYGTEAHLDALRRLGPSPIHRRSFAPVAESLRNAIPHAPS